MKTWLKGGLIGTAIVFLTIAIFYGSICVVPSVGGPLGFSGLRCMSAILSNITISLIMGGIPFSIFFAISGLFKKYWLRGGVISLLGTILMGFYLIGILEVDLMDYLWPRLWKGYGLIGLVLYLSLAFGLGSLIGWLAGKRKEVGK